MRLVLLPGLGADARLFDPQRSCAVRPEIVHWIAPAARDEPRRDYARRLAATIDPTPPLILGGASFGGMVALELARHVRPVAVVLIASCRSPKSLPRHYRPLSALAAIVSPALLARSRFVASRFGLRNNEDRQLFRDMLRAASPAFVQWASRAIFGWEGAEDLDVPVHHIHGADDRIIPLRHVQPDVVVPGAGHFLNVTHAAEVNAFLDARIAAARS